MKCQNAIRAGFSGSFAAWERPLVGLRSKTSLKQIYREPTVFCAQQPFAHSLLAICQTQRPKKSKETHQGLFVRSKRIQL
jgi:hypothetical protein